MEKLQVENTYSSLCRNWKPAKMLESGQSSGLKVSPSVSVGALTELSMLLGHQGAILSSFLGLSPFREGSECFLGLFSVF